MVLFSAKLRFLTLEGGVMKLVAIFLCATLVSSFGISADTEFLSKMEELPATQLDCSPSGPKANHNIRLRTIFFKSPGKGYLRNHYIVDLVYGQTRVKDVYAVVSSDKSLIAVGSAAVAGANVPLKYFAFFRYHPLLLKSLYHGWISLEGDTRSPRDESLCKWAEIRSKSK